MAEYDGLSPGQVLADASVAEFIKSLGLGIAEAQKALDENSVQQIAEFIEPREGLGGKTLLDLGLSPAFYHYQHADISCSLQLSLKVKKDFSLGLNINGSINDNSSNSSNSSESQSSSESGSSTRTSTRTANVAITSSSSGALVVGGENFQLSGSSPAERIRNLQNALTTNNATGIDRVLYQLEGSELTISTDANTSEVKTTPHTITFLGGGFDAGIIRVGQTTAIDYQLDDDPAPVTASTTAQGDLATQATHVRDQVQAVGYDAISVAPDAPVHTSHFETGRHEVPASEYPALRNLAQSMASMGFAVTIEGFADTQMYDASDRSRSDTLNVQLGNNRANEVKSILIANGAPAANITVTPSSGVQTARNAGDSDGTDNPNFRKAEVKTVGRSEYWVFVKARSGGPNLESVSPDKIGEGGSENGFIYLFKPTPLNLAGKKVTIDGTDFPFRGAAVAGHAENAPEAYAKNLADDINANAAAHLQGSATANVTTVSRDGDPYQLTLVTQSSRNIALSSTEGITVSEQFSRSSSSSMTQQNSGNRAVAFGASLDVRYSRQFEMNVTGNSSISARLVSIPAPPEFLETIKNFLNDGSDN
ncbi:OmpA family protein [Gynuella sp.]|uniref:OmpA family protein n=1 Tax=Gynuella sp. TaxID=2969146 RepID=UPI003D0F98B2